MANQFEVLKYIKTFHETHGRMPSSKECCEDLLIGRGSLGRILNRLATRGKLEKLDFTTIPYKLKDNNNG